MAKNFGHGVVGTESTIDEAAGGITTSVVTLVTALAPDFSTNLGEKALGILQSLSGWR